MTRAWIIMAFGAFTVLMALFVWAMCAIATRSNRRMERPTDCFSRYGLHVHDCEVCRPPDVRCAVGVGLLHEATETLVDNDLERQRAKSRRT
jgi:hypothetical protein